MEFLGGGLYNLATLVIALAALVVGGFGAYYARKAIFPSKRKLNCYALAVTSLLADESVTATGIEVRHEGVDLQDPYLATICLKNAGRYAVTSSHFDQLRPLVIDLGVAIKAVTKLSISPNGAASYKHSITGTKVLLGPDVLRPRQILIVQLLTDGVPVIDDLSSRVEFYGGGDIELDFKNPLLTVSNRLSSRVWILGVASSVLTGIVAAVLAATYFLSGPSVSLIPDNGAPGAQVTFVGTGVDEFSVVSAEMPTLDASGGSSTWTEVGHTQADEDGKFQASFKIPNGQAKGPVEVEIAVHELHQTRILYTTLYVR
jgi:hypothetical protein